MYMLCCKRKIIVFNLTQHSCFKMYLRVDLCLCFCKGGATALNIAAQEGHISILQFLLDKGAAIEAEDDVRKRYIHRKTQPIPFIPIFYDNLNCTCL